MSSYVQYLANLARLSNQKTFQKKMDESLDVFVDLLMFTKPREFSKTQNQIDAIIQTLKYFKIKSKKDEKILFGFTRALQNLCREREEAEVNGYKYIIGELKVLFYLYPLFISFLLIIISWNSLFLLGVSFVLIVILLFNLILLLDMDNLDYGSHELRISNLQALKDDYFVNK